MYGMPMDRYGPIPAGPGPMVCAIVIPIILPHANLTTVALHEELSTRLFLLLQFNSFFV
jgi:hypothetical protein